MGTAVNLFRRRVFSTIIIFALVGCGLVPSGSNQIRNAKEPFSGDRAYTHVRYLSENIGSRPASTDEARLAARYITEQLRSHRLGVDQPTFEYTTYKEEKVELEVIRPTVGSIRATSLMFSRSGEVTTELVDAGDGRAEDFPGRDVRGKIALMRRGDIQFSAKVSNAANAGAVGVVIYNNAEGELKGSLGKLSQIPAVAISREDGQRLLSILGQETVVVRLLVDAEVALKTSENVVGTRRGGSGKIVILGAHYDSVEVSPGANDNASGVGTVIELARVTATRSYPFELRFIAFGAEELGLVGSERYVETLSREERQSVVAVIIFDMVGVGDDLRFGGAVDLTRYGKAAASELGVEARDLEQKFSKAGDHASFMEANIPALMVNWQDDPHYHTKDDRAEFVRPDRLEITGKVALGILDELAKMEGARETHRAFPALVPSLPFAA